LLLHKKIYNNRTNNSYATLLLGLYPNNGRADSRY
jgi:hypothetical protein